METAVKERLVGAVVLVGLIVALVPEMLSGPRRGTAQEPASGDGAVRTFTIDLQPPPPQATVTEDSEGAVVGTVQVTPMEPVADANASPVPPPAREPERSTVSEPERSTARVPATADRAPSSAPALDSGWAVQLGSFASRENAERLAEEVRKGGYRAFVSRFEASSRVRYRVRVGPEQDRAQAEALARRLQRDGRQVSIVSHP
jgi:DedD protein